MAITTLQREALVELYVAILDRAPLKAGLDFWSDVFLGNGDDLIYTATEMWKSDGAQSVYGSSTPVEDLVETVFQHVFGRAPLQGGKDFWVAEWNANVTLYGDDEGAARTMLQMIDNVKNNPGANPDDKAIFENKVEFGDWFSKQGIDDPALAAAGFAQITPAASSIAAAQAFVDTDPAETVILTSLTNVETTGNNDDNFLATNATLNTSDKLDGDAGYDVLSVDVETSSGFNTAPKLSNIEKISVTVGGSNTNNGTIDLSRASGYEVLEVFQNERLYFTWADIQDVNDTELSIIDTYGDGGSVINYIYDTNAYEAGAGIDTARLTVAEVGNLGVQNSTSGVTAQVGPIVNLLNETPNGSSSNVDAVDLQSLWNGQVNDTTGNYIYDLNVGSQFRTLMIGGNDAGALGLPESTTNTDGNLEIERFLDASVRLVDATELAANLTLDLIGNSGQNGDATQGVLNVAQGGTDTGLGRTFSESITVLGAQGNDLISVSGSTNGLFELGNGADTLNVGSSTDLIDNDILDQNVQGHLIVKTGANNDVVRANITGIQNIDLGTGNDSLTLVGDVDNRLTSIYADGISTINAGDGADTVTLSAYALHLAPAKDKADNDYLIDLGTGSDLLTINGAGDQSITAGDGADSVTLNGFGHNNITGGEGADSITINGDGRQTVDSGTENDRVFINGTGVHDVKLGDGDDYLEINGAWNAENNFDYGDDDVTKIDAGIGNDVISVSLNHFLNVKLGEGDDQITLRATDLTVDDAIAGEAGTDTIVLTNQGGQEVFLRDSETSSVTGVERFDLRDSGITLHITEELHDTAEGNDITVITEQSTGKIDLPKLTLLNVAQPLKAANAEAVAADLLDLKDNATINAFSQGMSREDWDAIVEDWEDGIYAEAWTYGFTEADLVEYVRDNGVVELHFVNADLQGSDSDLVDEDRAPVPGTDEDEVYFITNLAPAQTIDITDAPLSLANGRNFTLLGGTIKDIVIGDEASINGRATLRYDGVGQSNSIEDTLVVVGSAQLNASDLRNVSGLEIIELTSETTAVQTWTIDLTDQVINQTTGLADLVIRVDDRVPPGSKLIIKTDSTVPNATNGVRIESSGNLVIEVNGQIVGESDFNTPLSQADGYGNVGNIITVVGQLNFTGAQDSLIGTDGPDTFHAEFVAQIQNGDSAEGNDHVGGVGYDQLIVDENISNPTGTVFSAFGGASITEIEKLVFNTADNVQVMGLGGYDFDTVQTGSGNDNITAADAGVEWFMGAGNDTVSVSGFGSDFYIDGESGADVVNGYTRAGWWDILSDDDILNVSSVETVLAGGGDDLINYHYAPDNASAPNGNNGAISVDGGSGSDTLHLDDDGTNGLATVTDVEWIFGGDGADNVLATEGGNIWVYGDDNHDNSLLLSGNDTLNVTAGSDVYLEGEGGSDSITVSASDDITIYGDLGASGEDGNDTINAVNTGTSDGNTTSIWGGGGHDIINFTAMSFGNIDADADLINGQGGNDVITVNVGDDANVFGESGTDFIDIYAGGAVSVDGGSDNDTIAVEFGDNGGVDNAIVLGGTGADSIVMDNANASDFSSITGGAGNDTINLLNPLTGGQDTLIFGNQAYSAGQALTTDTQGTDTVTGFVFEEPAPGDPTPAVEDFMNFSAFLGSTLAADNIVTVPGGWNGSTTINGDVAAGNALIVLSNTGTLTAASFGANGNGGPIQLNDNGRAVVVVGNDADGSGITTFTVYYVQDISTGAGQTWAVNVAATVTSATAVGIEEVMDNLLAGINENAAPTMAWPLFNMASITADNFTLTIADANGDAVSLVNDVNGVTALVAGANVIATQEQAVVAVTEIAITDTFNVVDTLAGPSPVAGLEMTLFEGTSVGEWIEAIEVTDTNLIYGFGGNDTLIGGGAFDALIGGFGADVIRGGDATDGMFGEGGDDSLVVLGSIGNEYQAYADGVLQGLIDAAGLTGVVTVAELKAGRASSESDTGELIDGGDGNDTLFVFGTATFTSASVTSINNLGLFSDVTIDLAILDGLTSIDIYGDGPHAIELSNGTFGDFETWIMDGGVLNFIDADAVSLEIQGITLDGQDISNWLLGLDTDFLADEVAAGDLPAPFFDLQEDTDGETVAWYDHTTEGVVLDNFDADGGGQDAIDFYPEFEETYTYWNGTSDFVLGNVGNVVKVYESDPGIGGNWFDEISADGFGGDFIVVGNGADGIILAANSAFSTTANVFHVYDADTSGNVAVQMDLIGQVNLGDGTFIDLNAGNVEIAAII